jgi:outer membrane biosynthesis protein TonB
MPWARVGEDDRRFRKTLAAALLLSLLLGLVVPQIRLPIPERWEVIVVPERLTRLIRQERQPPPPPPVQEEVRPLDSEPQKPEEPQIAKEAPVKKTKRVTSKGILAFREKFSSLADSKLSARLGAQARIRKSGKAASGRPQRSLVATQRPGSSGGIDVGSLSRDVGGSGEGLEGVEIARATSGILGVAGPDRLLSDGPSAGRTDEEIQIVFDRHKAALYRLYNRELRRDPTLKGQVVLRIRIEPDGSVSLCNVHSTDMNAPDLSAQVVARVERFDFGAKEDVSAITILYPIDFLPAA